MNARDLKVGRTYFTCGFPFRNRPIPSIETWVYVGLNVLPEDRGTDKRLHYFQDPRSYFAADLAEGHAPGEAPSVPEKALIRVEEEDLSGIDNLDKLVAFVNGLSNEPGSDAAF